MFSFRFLFSIRSLLSLSALSGLTAAGVAGAWIVSSYRRDSEQKYIGGGGEGSSLVADPTALELGEVWESDAHRVEVPLTNKGETTITISRFATTCSCSSVEPTSIEIPPGETRRVVMALDLQPSSREEADKPTTDFSVDLTPFLAGEPEQQGPTWQVTARVRRPLLRTPRQIDLGWHSERAQPFEPVLVTVDIAPGIDGLKAFGTKMLVSLNRDKKGTSRYILSVTPIGPLQVGEVSGFVRLTPYRKGEALPSRTISVRGRVVDDVELTPTGVIRDAIDRYDPDGDRHAAIANGNGLRVGEGRKPRGRYARRAIHRRGRESAPARPPKDHRDRPICGRDPPYCTGQRRVDAPDRTPRDVLRHGCLDQIIQVQVYVALR